MFRIGNTSYEVRYVRWYYLYFTWYMKKKWQEDRREARLFNINSSEFRRYLPFGCRIINHRVERTERYDSVTKAYSILLKR